ncbi:MAG TPA: hypothetical protein PKK10_08215 [Woeseiaceae bacterium]|nr:hypothetical protein [Woeseiaceae bacterium]
MRSASLPQHAQHGVSRTTATEPPRPPLPVGETLVDLVCHEAVTLRAHTSQRHWAGDTFYFCSPFCQRRFDAAPAAYVPSHTRDLTLPFCSGGDHAAA